MFTTGTNTINFHRMTFSHISLSHLNQLDELLLKFRSFFNQMHYFIQSLLTSFINTQNSIFAESYMHCPWILFMLGSSGFPN